MSADRHRARQERNELSRNAATHHREEWLDSEIEMLMAFYDGTRDTLEDLAEILGRTIEACRERYLKTKNGYYSSASGKTTRADRAATTKPTARPAWMDEEGLPDWYV